MKKRRFASNVTDFNGDFDACSLLYEVKSEDGTIYRYTARKRNKIITITEVLSVTEPGKRLRDGTKKDLQPLKEELERRGCTVEIEKKANWRDIYPDR